MTMAAQPHFVTAVSEALVAVALTQQNEVTLRVLIYYQGLLQTTLTSTKHASKMSLLQKLLFLDETAASSLAAISSQGVVIWNLNRGVVAHSIEINGIILDAQTVNSNNQDLYLLVEKEHSRKLVIQHYRGPKLVRKIKTKHARHLILNDKFMAVAQGTKMRIHNTETGKVVHKVTLPARVTSWTCCTSRTDAAAVRLDTGVILQVNLGEGSTEELATFSGTSSSGTATLTSLEWRDKALLVDGQFLLLPQGETKTLLDLATIEAGVIKMRNEELVAVLYKNGGYQIQTGSVDSLFAWKEALDEPRGRQTDEVGAYTKNSKSDVVSILGPAQAGGQAHIQDYESSASPPTKKAKVEEDETVAARLARLKVQLEADEAEETVASTVFQPKKATTESLTQLLQQALTDDAMLELCLAVCDTKILQETCSKLTHEEIGTLVSAITVRLAQKPGRADALCLWLQVLLQTRRVPLSVLQPLQNLLQERIEVFPALLKLQGRLSMLGSE